MASKLHFVGCLALILLASCAAGIRASAPLEAVPFPAERVISATNTQALDGSDAQQKSAGATVNGTSLRLVSSAGSMEFAVYGFALPADADPQTVTLNFEAANSTGAWVALADYEKQQWHFALQVIDFSSPLNLPLAAANISPSRNVWIAVIVSEGTKAGVAGLSLEEQVPDPLVPPIASLTSGNGNKVRKGDSVLLDASGSSDSDGPIVDYQWDLDGDDIFNEPGDEQSQQGQPTANLVVTGEPSTSFTVSVQVIDEDGLSDTASLDLSIVGWAVVTVDSGPNLAQTLIDLKVVGGKPAIAYYDPIVDTVKYAFTPDADGLSGWNHLPVLSSLASADTCTLTDFDGQPAIGVAVIGDSLKYSYSHTPDVDGSWSSVNVDSFLVGSECGMANINGHPAFAYQFGDDEPFLRYAYGEDFQGSSWTYVDFGEDFTPGHIGLTLNASGKPVIVKASWDLADFSDRLDYMLSSTSDGKSHQDWSYVFQSIIATDLSFEILPGSGYPAIAYSGGGAKYAVGNGPDLQAPWTVVQVPASGGYGSSLAIVHGAPAISHMSGSTPPLDVLYSHTDDPVGVTGWVTDPTGLKANFASLVEVDGHAALAFNNDSGLQFALLYE